METNHIDKDKLALYVAGTLPETEMIAITQSINTNPNLKKQVEEIEQVFIAFSALHAPPISSRLQDNILKIGQNTPNSIQPNSSRFRVICALGWFLLAVSLFYNFYQYQQQQKLKKEQDVFVQKLDELNQKYELTKTQFAEIRQPETKTIILESTGKVPDIQAVVFWNEATQNVYVDAAALPEPPEGKVYQLWWMISLDPLTPNDGGLLDNFEENDQKLFVAKPTGKAVAFAITLEPAGGSESPTLEELYVLGTV